MRQETFEQKEKLINKRRMYCFMNLTVETSAENSFIAQRPESNACPCWKTADTLRPTTSVANSVESEKRIVNWSISFVSRIESVKRVRRARADKE